MDSVSTVNAVPPPPVILPTIVNGGLCKETKKVSWKINNFDTIQESEELIRAQLVCFKMGESIGRPTDCEVYMRVQPNKVIGDAELQHFGNSLTIFCEMVDDRHDEIYAVFNANVKYERTEAFFTGKVLNYKSRAWGHANIVDLHQPQPYPAKYGGCLHIDMDFTVFGPADISSMTQGSLNDGPQNNGFTKKLTGDLLNLLQSGTGDVTIISGDGVEFKVLKGMLSARSPVFQRMLETNMKESQTGVIHVEDLSSKTVAVILQYLYTGTLNDAWRKDDVIVELVYGAGKYELVELTAYLENVLGGVCNEHTVCKLISLCNKLGMKQAESDLLEYVRRRWAAVSSSEEVVSLLN